MSGVGACLGGALCCTHTNNQQLLHLELVCIAFSISQFMFSLWKTFESASKHSRRGGKVQAPLDYDDCGARALATLVQGEQGVRHVGLDKTYCAVTRLQLVVWHLEQLTVREATTHLHVAELDKGEPAISPQGCKPCIHRAMASVLPCCSSLPPVLWSMCIMCAAQYGFRHDACLQRHC
jgi:hypothetical protein